MIICNADQIFFAGFYYKDPEITPPVKADDYRYDPDDNVVSTLSPEREVRAVVEGQILAKYVHAQSLGYKITPTSRILATGGASQNASICQVHLHKQIAQKLSCTFFFNNKILIP